MVSVSRQPVVVNPPGERLHRPGPVSCRARTTPCLDAGLTMAVRQVRAPRRPVRR